MGGKMAYHLDGWMGREMPSEGLQHRSLPFHTHSSLLPPSPPLSQACTIEVKLYCKDVPEGEARVIRCLQENKYQKDFGKECKEKVGGKGGV